MPLRHEIRYDARTLPLGLALCVLVLTLLHVVAVTVYFNEPEFVPEGFDLHFEQVEVLDLDTEQSLGTWFSAVLLLFVGRLLWVRWRAGRAAGERGARAWCWLSLGFHALSLDEVAGFHEYLNETLRRPGGEGGEVVPWVLVGAPVALVALGLLVPWFLRLPRSLQAHAVLGAILYLGGSLYVEGISPFENNLRYHFWIALEEFLEMIGPVVFLRGLLPYLALDVPAPPAPSAPAARA